MLACRDLDLRAGGRLLVQALSLRVAPGERWVVIGPNGAGKSTLLAALAGARVPDRGTIELGDRPIGQWSVEALAAQRALVTDRWLDPFAASVLDTVLTARFRLRDDPDGESIARRALASMDCGGLAARDVRSLSRGERQRVAIATALAQGTALVLLDEPTSHQDPGHQAEVLARLAQQRDCSFVAVLHDVNAAVRFATHALLLSGRGGWRAGPCAQVLTAAALSELFATGIVAATIGARTVFVVDGSASGTGALDAPPQAGRDGPSL
jgi:iron complex transport system ATP-binding protein